MPRRTCEPDSRAAAPRAVRRLGRLAVLAILAFAGAPAFAQSVNVVYVDDSAQALELLLRAREQAAENPGESARLYQQILEEYGDRLVPISPERRDLYVGVRGLVQAELRRRPEVLERSRAMHDAAAERMLAQGELETAVRTLPFTAAGLDAALALAQDALESARFAVALRMLDEIQGHPDLHDARRRHALAMEMMAARLGDDPARGARAEAQLADLRPESEPLLAHARAVVATARPPRPRRGVGPFDVPETEDLSDLVPQTIWTYPLDDESPGARRDLAPSATTATIADDGVFVNDGRFVAALDRFTARPLWPTPFLDLEPRSGDSRGEDSPGDLSTLTVEDDAVVALVGQIPDQNRMNHGAVVCLERDDGRLRWRVTLGLLGGEQISGLFPHGVPLVRDGLVHVLARRVTPERISSAYVVAIDLERGAIRWIRHVASSGNRTTVARPFATLLRVGDRIVASTSIGAIASLDPTTGDIAWLRRGVVPTQFREATLLPWAMGGAVSADGRLVALSPDFQRVEFVDPGSGELLRTVDAGGRDEWGSPAYLVASGRIVVAVGDTIAAFDVDAPEHPLWTLPARGGAADQPGAWTEPVRISGRVQATHVDAIVPTDGGVLLLDLETGLVRHRLEAETSANPVAFGAQLVVAAEDRVESFMSIERAEAMIRRQIADRATDPDPAISLLQLGLRADRLELAEEGTRLAMAAIDALGDGARADRAGEELFDLLLQLEGVWRDRPRPEAARVHALLAGAARTAEQIAAQRLALADWMTEADPLAAARALQEVVGDPRLASVERVDDEVRTRAAESALRRLTTLGARHRTILVAAEAEAQAALARVLPDERHLVAFAHPLAEASVDAVASGARALPDDEAISLLFSGLRGLRAPTGASRLAGPLVDALLRRGRPAIAAAVLRRIASGHPEATLESSSGSRSVVDWIAEIESTARLPRPPRLADPRGEVRIVPGSLPVTTIPGGPVAPTGEVLLFDAADATLHCRAGAELELRWTAPISDGGLRVEGFGDGSVIAFLPGFMAQPGLPADPKIVRIDLADGAVRWETPRLDEVLRPLVVPPGFVRELMPNGQQFDPTEVESVVDGDLVFLVRRSGDVAAFAVADGSEPAWTASRVLDQVHLALAMDAGLILLGRDLAENGEALTRIVVLDRADGTVRARQEPRAEGGVTWARIDAEGCLVLGTPEGVERRDPRTGRWLWTTEQVALASSRAAWIGDAGTALVEDRAGGLRALDLDTGRSRPVVVPGSGGWEAAEVDEVRTWGRGFAVRYPGRIMQLDADGTLLGADAITEDRQFVGLVAAADRVLAASIFQTAQIQLPDDVRPRTRWDYRLYRLGDGMRLLGPVLEMPPIMKRLRAGAATDGWVLLSTEAETLAVPMTLQPEMVTPPG